MKYHFLFFIAASFFNCSKNDNPEIQLPVEGTYLSTNTVQFQPIRLFTMHGEVKDERIIYKFAAHKQLTELFNMGTGTEKEKINVSIRINGDKSVECKYGSKIFKGSLADYEGNILKVTGTRSEGRAAQPAGESCSDRPKTINLWRFDHQVDCLDVPSSTGNIKQCKLLPGFFLVVEASHRIYIPAQNFYVSNYIKHNDQHSECNYSATGAWNLVNPDFYKNLRVGDTLVVQEKRLMLEKN